MMYVTELLQIENIIMMRIRIPVTFTFVLFGLRNSINYLLITS